MRDDLSSCIGCGCLSLQACRLYNPDDRARVLGQGPRYLLGDSSLDVVPELAGREHKRRHGDVGERLAHGVLAHRAREEVGVHPRVQAGRVEEHELAELALADHAVLDELVRLFDRLGHVGHVPVRDVGAEDRPQARAGRVDVLGERPRDEPVVGLAAEVEVRHEAVAEVVDRVERGGRELVELLGPRRSDA